MLECQNCGATGDSFFSENYFGEMVCELCGTQSFLQARNETQEAEDMGIDVTTVSKTLKQRTVRKPKRHADAEDMEKNLGIKKNQPQKVTPRLPELLDCVIATQMVLDAMARTLVARIGSKTFPVRDYPKTVKSLWFKFLATWGVKGTKPLLRCYNEFFLYYTKEEEKSMDPAVTMNLLEQWDAEWERNQKREENWQANDEENDEHESMKDTMNHQTTEPPSIRKKDKHIKTNGRQAGTLNDFSMVDLLGILMLASRVLNLGLLPSDFADWVATGVIPYHNALATTCANVPDVKESVKFVAHFFHSAMKRHRANTVQIAYSANHLMYHMGLRLPPLNVPLAVHRICTTMGFPTQVFRNFQWISGYMNVNGEIPEPPLLLQAETDGYPRFDPPTEEDKARVYGILESEVGMVAHLVVAIKMCANWHEWIYERRRTVEDDEESKRNDKERQQAAPPATAVHNSDLLSRRDLNAYTEFARQVFVDPERSCIPDCLQEHLEELKRIERTDESEQDSRDKLQQNRLYAYPALHIDGVLAEKDDAIEKRMKRLRSQDTNSDAASNADKEEDTYDAFFYPHFFLSTYRSGLHSATEHVLELLCRKIDAPIASVLPVLAELDKRMQSLIYHFERTDFHVNLLKQGQTKWKATKKKSRKEYSVVRA